MARKMNRGGPVVNRRPPSIAPQLGRNGMRLNVFAPWQSGYDRANRTRGKGRDMRRTGIGSAGRRATAAGGSCGRMLFALGATILAALLAAAGAQALDELRFFRIGTAATTG